jgi:Skp family chaperone for outer membrane proteins
MKSVARLLVIVLVASLPASAFAQAQELGISAIRLASFSPQRAFAESAEGKTGIAMLTALQEKRAREIEDRNKALQARDRALQQSLAVLTEDAKAQRTKELEKFRLDIQRFIQDAQAEFLGVQRDIESAFAAKLRPALDRVAKDKGLQLVLNLDEPTIIAWAAPSLDITADVVKQLALAVPEPGR